MAEVLKTFLEGEDILASETNANNQFLLGKISDNADRLQNFVDGEITSIQSNLASAQATLQNSINELTETVNNGLGNVYENIAPNYSAGISIAAGWTSISSGWLYLQGMTDGTSSVRVDGTYFQVSYDTGDGQSNGNLFMYLSKGAVVTNLERIARATFYPCKGVKNA